jgi:predicted solute-binding protein
LTNKALNSEGEMLKVNLNRAIRNCVILALAEPKSAEEMAIKVGIDKEHLQPFLEAMVREKSIILDNNRYIMNK